MISFEDFCVLRELIDRHLQPDGFIYVGTADFFRVEELRSFEKLLELGFIEPIVMMGYNYVEPKYFYDFREFPYLLTTLGMISYIWPDTVVENAFAY